MRNFFFSVSVCVLFETILYASLHSDNTRGECLFSSYCSTVYPLFAIRTDADDILQSYTKTISGSSASPPRSRDTYRSVAFIIIIIIVNISFFFVFSLFRHLFRIEYSPDHRRRLDVQWYGKSPFVFFFPRSSSSAPSPSPPCPVNGTINKNIRVYNIYIRA